MHMVSCRAQTRQILESQKAAGPVANVATSTILFEQYATGRVVGMTNQLLDSNRSPKFGDAFFALYTPNIAAAV